jgi:hypothetical protein
MSVLADCLYLVHRVIDMYHIAWNLCCENYSGDLSLEPLIKKTCTTSTFRNTNTYDVINNLWCADQNRRLNANDVTRQMCESSVYNFNIIGNEYSKAEQEYQKLCNDVFRVLLSGELKSDTPFSSEEQYVVNENKSDIEVIRHKTYTWHDLLLWAEDNTNLSWIDRDLDNLEITHVLPIEDAITLLKEFVDSNA